jgi:hypothetical protein
MAIVGLSIDFAAELNFNFPRFDDDPFDVLRNQFLVRWVRAPLPADFVETIAHGLFHHALDLGRRDSGHLPCPLLLFLQDRVGDVVSIPHAPLIRVGRGHAVAPLVKNAAHKDGRGALQLQRAAVGAIGKFCLNGIEQRSIDNGLLFAGMNGAPIRNLADVEPVAQEMGESTDAEGDATSDLAGF